MIADVASTSVFLTWEPPEFDGGRDDIYYELFYQRSDGSEPQMSSGTVMGSTEGEITGLLPLTEYNVFVSAENGVSSQAVDCTQWLLVKTRGLGI